jgi:hypothetical protein
LHWPLYLERCRTASDASLAALLSAVESHLLARLPALRLFDALLQLASYDSGVLLDWVIDDQTNFLALLLSFLKLCSAAPSAQPERMTSDMHECLSELQATLSRLQVRSLLPFNATPLITRLAAALDHVHH